VLDTLGGYLAIAVVFLGMGSVAYHDPLSHTIVSQSFVMDMAGLSTAFAFIPRVLMHRQLATKASNENASSIKDKQHYGLVQKIALNICDPAGFQEHIMVIAIIFHLGTEFTLGYCFLNFAIMVFSIYKMIKEK
jgi:hypothetical protein